MSTHGYQLLPYTNPSYFLHFLLILLGQTPRPLTGSGRNGHERSLLSSNELPTLSEWGSIRGPNTPSLTSINVEPK